MRISIAMTTFNGERYLKEQLTSLVHQTRNPSELVVCDDGSTDATIAILEAFRQQAPFQVSIFQNDLNLGYTKNFEKAISNCSGDLIFLSDQDDIWHPTKIEIVGKAFLAHPDKQLVIHNGELVDENLVSHGATKLGQVIAGYGTDEPFVTGALTAIRREFLPYILPIPEGVVGHDGWIHNLARLLNARIVLNQSLQMIRRHSTNTSTWVASSIKKINRLDVWKSQFQTPVANRYDDRILINESCQRRLKNALCHGNMFSIENLEKALSYLVLERRALHARDQLVKADFLPRKIRSLQLLLSGDYQFFNGYKSFLRDIAR